MTHDRKYFGMTTTQIGIIAGLAGAACLLFGLTGLFVLRGRFLRQPPANTPVVGATATPFTILSLTLTMTPTPIPYELLIPNGWIQFKTGLVEIWLPPSFKAAGPNTASGITGSSVVLEMALTGSSPSSSLNNIFVTVSYEPLTSDSLETFLDTRLENIPADINMAERRKVLMNSTPAYRLMFERHSNNVDTNDLLFVFLDGSTVWYVKYSAQINEFYEMLPTFEESVKTFRVVR